MKIINLLILISIIFIACKKEEGTGGKACIKGVVKTQNINILLENSGIAYAALDKDVFIQYGNHSYVDDKIETSANGIFSFNYLTPGTYLIYTYSDDTSLFDSKKEIAISYEIEIKKNNETIDLGTITTYKQIDIDEGSAYVCGVIMKITHINGTSVPLDTIPAQDEDIFLFFKNSNAYTLKSQTQYNGSYHLYNLIPGEYSLLAYSQQNLSKEDIPILQKFIIKTSDSKLELDTLYINDF